MSKEKNNPSKPLLTHLEKVYWPDEGYTKGDLIHYYQTIAPFILPYLKDRPETLRRFPDGIEGEEFYQKNVDDRLPEWMPTAPVRHQDKEYHYLMISDIDSLLYTINLGCIDLNPFNSRIQHLNYPDYLVIDLDPENIEFDAVIETALTFHALFNEYEIPCYCKTSGATGLHLYVPTGAKYTYEQVKWLAELLAHQVLERLPKITSLERSPSKRQKKVYLDYLQNNFGQTMAAPYSVRPRPHAPVSTPLEWSEVKPGLDPTSFTMITMPKRLEKKGDLFLPVLKKGIDLTALLKRWEKEDFGKFIPAR